MVFVGAGGCLVNLAVILGFSHSLFCPHAGVDVSGVFFRVEVGRRHQELRAAAALDEHNLVIIGDFHQLTQERFSFGVQRSIFSAAVAHFNNTHAGVGII